MFDSKNIFDTALLVVVQFIKISNVYFDLSQCRLSEENIFLKLKLKLNLVIIWHQVLERIQNGKT